jgi:hypothetical protein
LPMVWSHPNDKDQGYVTEGDHSALSSPSTG